MRFMILFKSHPSAEAGIPPKTHQIQATMAYHTKMNDAGIILAAEGLQPSSQGARVFFHGQDAAPTVKYGPFEPAHELLFSYYIIEVNKLEEALEWAKNYPVPEKGTSIEVRRIAELDDFRFEGPVMEGIKKDIQRMERERKERGSAS